MASPASATNTDTRQQLEDSYNLEVIAEAALTADKFEETSSAFHLSTPNVSVEVPKDSEELIVLNEADEEAIGISLPFADQTDVAEIGDFGEISFDHGNRASTSVLPYGDGSVQMVTTIEDSSAPTEYSYDLELPEGATLEILPDGMVLVLDAQGEFFAGVAAPWAKDAEGADVPTHYEIRDSSLVQVVDHQIQGTNYPVTADPWLGRALISRVWVTVHPQGYKVNVVATAWGRAFNGAATHNAHVAELVSKTAPGRITPTIREQYLCHVAGNLFEWEDYNMESWLPYKPWWQQLNPIDQCNPGGSRYS